MQGGNGWGNVFHSGDNPMAQFDAGSTNLMPFSMGYVQPTQKTPSVDDFMRALAAKYWGSSLREI